MITPNKDIILFFLNVYIIYFLHKRPDFVIYIRNFIYYVLSRMYTIEQSSFFIEFIYGRNLNDNGSELIENEETNINNETRINDNIIKYEDKYLKEIRLLNKEFVFKAEEEEERNEVFLSTFSELNKKLLEEIRQVKSKIDKNKLLIANYELKKEDYCVFNEECESGRDREDEKDESGDDESINGDDESINGDTKEKEMQALIYDNECLEKEYNKLIKVYEDQKGLKEEATIISRKYIINKQLEKLKNCYVMEKTPLGNVLMIYNIQKNSFSYYSDNTIPYRYLETVARKYVKTFNCRPIFVDMEEELKIAEEKWEKERIEKEQKEKEKEIREKETNEDNLNKILTEKKKNVFAKFKSYNKDTSATTKSMAAPPKNSIPNTQLTKEQENEKILLKEKANCYTYEGKFANFSFLKKVDRKVVDKKYGLTFADFKKIRKSVN